LAIGSDVGEVCFVMVARGAATRGAALAYVRHAPKKRSPVEILDGRCHLS